VIEDTDRLDKNDQFLKANGNRYYLSCTQSIPAEVVMTKTISFAAMHFSVAFGVTYALTGDLVVGGLVALVEPAVNTVGYYFHEKIWERIRDRRGSRQAPRTRAAIAMPA
jgi:uncharacterized membrane protein